jgi:hypothetical protein
VSNAREWEFLSEKALEAGHVDLLAKEAYPAGRQRTLPIEVKLGALNEANIRQAMAYRGELGEGCIGAALIGAGASKSVLERAKAQGIRLFSFHLDVLDQPMTFPDIVQGIRLAEIG